jgi:hypothetical protein
VAAAIAALATPARDASPPDQTPESKKSRTPEKSKSRQSPVEEKQTTVEQKELPVHYKRLLDDLRLLDETLSIFRSQNQIPFFSALRDNMERVSGRRFTLDHFRQLMTATGGALFKAEWQLKKDIQGKAIQYDLTVRATDHERDGVEIFKRLSSEQSKSRSDKIITFLQSKLDEYFEKAGSTARSENAYPIKPFELPVKPRDDRTQEPGVASTPVSGRSRILSKCDSIASDGSAVRTPKSSLRRQLSVSASPVMPNILPQFVATSTPVKLPLASTPTPPMSAKEKLQAIRDRVKAKEEKDVEEAKQYDADMERKARMDEYDFAIKLVVKLNHKFPRGIDSAKLSTLKKDYGSLFVHADDVEKWTLKICELVPHRFAIEKVNDESVLRFKTTDVKFSVIKKEIEDLKTVFATSIRE